jgi:ADP-ribose pyrophosphatase YjhB (NUDIX family)
MERRNDEDAIADLFAIADGLQVIAGMGLQYCKSDYDRERYEKVMLAGKRIIATLDNKPALDGGASFHDISDRLTPFVGVEAAVFRQGQLLLIRRSDNGLWAVPGGLADFGETLAEGAVRELKEETGLSGKIVRFLGVFDLRLWRSQLKKQTHSVVFEISDPEGTPVITNEATDCGFFSADKLPELSPGHEMRVPLLFKLTTGEVPTPFFDF